MSKPFVFTLNFIIINDMLHNFRYQDSILGTERSQVQEFFIYIGFNIGNRYVRPVFVDKIPTLQHTVSELSLESLSMKKKNMG